MLLILRTGTDDSAVAPTPLLPRGCRRSVVIVDGPFVDLTGVVRFVDSGRKRVGVVVMVFGDETLIDIPLPAVEKSA